MERSETPISEANEVTIHGQAFRVFECYDLLIHLCLHLDKHFNGSHMQLYSRADIAHLLAQWGAEIDATELRQRCATYNAEKEVMKVPGMVQTQLPPRSASAGQAGDGKGVPPEKRQVVLVVVSVSAMGRLQRIFLEEEMRVANGRVKLNRYSVYL